MRKFKVGDKLRIRQWEDMAEEFGSEPTGSSDSIGCLYSFPATMKHLCGLPFTVRDVFGDQYFSEERTEELRYDGRDRWMISADMLEYAEEQSQLLSCDIDGLFNLGFGGAV